MKLLFLGTRGYISAHNRLHRRHSSLLVSYGRKRVMIDCGEDWIGHIESIHPDAIFITHAHPDHAGALLGGAGCPVYTTRAAWATMDNCEIKDRRIVETREPVALGRLAFEAFSVIHSLRAPAVGYRISGGRVAIFYVPDVVEIQERAAQALHGIRIFIGDGASMTRPLVRQHGNKLFGHTTVRAQLHWCHEAGVKRAIFTHCGSQIVGHEQAEPDLKLRAMAREEHVDAQFAYDGMEVLLR
jgi:phosphoribosyl 1,2-cyclic phosphodiesterase